MVRVAQVTPLPDGIDYYCCPGLPLRDWRSVPITEDTTHLQVSGESSQVWSCNLLLHLAPIVVESVSKLPRGRSNELFFPLGELLAKDAPFPPFGGFNSWLNVRMVGHSLKDMWGLRVSDLLHLPWQVAIQFSKTLEVILMCIWYGDHYSAFISLRNYTKQRNEQINQWMMEWEDERQAWLLLLHIHTWIFILCVHVCVLVQELNSQFSCLSLLSAGIMGMSHLVRLCKTYSTNHDIGCRGHI